MTKDNQGNDMIQFDAYQRAIEKHDALKAALAWEREVRKELAKAMNGLMQYPHVTDCHGHCERCDPCNARAALAKAKELEKNHA